ncbi:metallophosphoesterase family protein [candidate division CSSED10-310 bacterium]|uniref:Metallophosphoesterase family protein n=1 Tax=candidate division CSSED10-310 bacterium TaxID=2855610 RepID=A0ABV6YUD3_UNCC1
MTISSSMPASSPIPALLPRDGAGHQFVCYADCCSGVPAAAHEANFAAVNAVVARLKPPPEFICFPGDEIRGLTADDEMLRRQWSYWFEHEMAWLDRRAIPLYHTTGNHTTYDLASEVVFRTVLAHLPRNGPPGQEGLTYFVRRNDLLLVFVNTMWSGLGGEGRVETTWLDQTLSNHADAQYKIVLGHHPVYSVNGFSGTYQRDIAPENGRKFWQVLVSHKVLAYLCSHILAFDVQVHEGVLQFLTAGAGTMPRMPEENEYLHCVQAALDAGGLRYQVLDTSGQIREWLTWPIELQPSATWAKFEDGEHKTPVCIEAEPEVPQAWLVVWRFSGICPPAAGGEAQTLLCGWNTDQALAPLWIGLRGSEHSLCLLLSSAPGRSPHLWSGPALPSDKSFEIQIAVHSGMGPGGLLWRWDDTTPWSSLTGSSAWGAERLIWPTRWNIGNDQRGPTSHPFRGNNLQVTWSSQIVRL